MINELLNFVFPKRCVSCKKLGSYVCGNCFAYLSFDVKNLCLVCQRPVPNSLSHKSCLGKYAIDGCFSAISYNKIAKQLIYNFKYKPYLTDLKNLLSQLLYESLIQNENFQNIIQNSKPSLVPIPLFPSKYRSRGYNQSEILAKELSRRLDLPFSNLLARTKKTKPQMGLKLEQRRKNIKGVFDLNSPLKNVRLFLVDDIVTTGSTLLEAANVLKRRGAKEVYGITLARD